MPYCRPVTKALPRIIYCLSQRHRLEDKRY
jgi:hypothetical protein